MSIIIKDLKQLEEALQQHKQDLVIAQSIIIPHPICLPKGTSLRGIDGEMPLLAFSNGDGISLAGDNLIENLSIQTAVHQRAIYIDSTEEDLGTITLNNLIVTGQVQILTRAPHKYLTLNIDGLDIVAADTRRASERPLKYGVTVHQGALTIYNYSDDKESVLKANVKHVSLGRPYAPVIGSGVFIGSFNESSSKVEVEFLQTDAIYSNGMIPFGQPTLITGGIFLLTGAHAKEIETTGPVITYGVNDMVLDVWGEVDKWVCHDIIRSYGTSCIGFVNFGIVHNFEAKSPIETYGSCARGFNQYDGTIDHAVFEAVSTYGDGSIGMQFSKPVGTIKVNKDIETHGATGESLVKGEIQSLDATAFSVKAGGAIKHFQVGGNIKTNGKEILAFSVEEDGEISDFTIGGNIITAEETSQAVDLSDDAKLPEEVKSTIKDCIH